MKKIACYIFSYEITKGMKSIGPKGLLKSKKSKELINCQISNIQDKNIDICVISGFGNEKLKKKIEHKNVSIIDNDLYDSANQGYAIELILQTYNQEKYDGCIIVNNGILFNSNIKTDILLNRQDSKIYYTTGNDKKNNFHIGCTINGKYIQHLFFNLSSNFWNEILYIDSSTIELYKEIYKPSMRNMFLFELINQSIDKGAKYSPIKLKSNHIIKINNNKDSHKIKEKI